MVLTQSSSAQAILRKYRHVEDVIVPTMPELLVLFQDLGEVDISLKKPTRLTVAPTDGEAIEFPNRLQAWEYYLGCFGLLSSRPNPWALPSVFDQANAEVEQHIQNLADLIAPERCSNAA